MSSNDTPIEILLKIFESLPRYTLKECQFVNKSWYQAARQLLLETVNITATNTVQFSDYMKHNPSHRNCIKTVYIRLKWDYPQPGDPSPDEISKLVQDNCPKVQAVHGWPRLGSAGVNLLNNLRNKITEIEIDSQNSRGVVLTQFPRLKKAKTDSSYGFQDCLQLFEKSPLLEDLHLESFYPEDNLQIQPNAALLNTLSKLKRFHAYLDGIMGSTTMNNFIKQYFTGLQYLSVEGWMDWYDISPHEKPLMVDLMSIACTVREFAIYVKYLNSNVVRRNLPSIMQKVYYQIPETRKEKIHRMLSIETTREGEDDAPPFNMLASCTENQPGELTRSIELTFVLEHYNRRELQDVVNQCLELRDLDSIHIFIRDYEPPRSTFTIFRKLLGNLNYIKKVVLDVPDETFNKPYTNRCESVTDLKICSSTWYEDNMLNLANVAKMFPKVKRMNLSGDGVLPTITNDCQFVLGKLELDSLEINTGGWLTKTRSYFLLSVDVSQKNIKRFYKVVYYNGLWVNDIQENEFGQSHETNIYVKVKNLNTLTLYREEEFSKEVCTTTLSFK